MALSKETEMAIMIDFIREWLREHPNVSNALAGLIVVIIAAIAADLGVGEPGAEAVRVIAP